jgi:hypothetical protein
VILKEIFISSIDPIPEPFDQYEKYSHSNHNGDKEESNADKQADKKSG